MASGLHVFNKAASVAYNNISLAEKEALKSFERVDCIGPKAIKKMKGKKYFYEYTERGNGYIVQMDLVAR